MRHAIAGNKLGRQPRARQATVRDVAKATLIQQRIMTTKAKAKEARKLVDQLITLGKRGTLADKRHAFAILCDHELVSRLFRRTSSLFKSRNGGYTRIITLGQRRGDNAQLVYLELTEKEEVVISQPKSTAIAKKEKVKAVKKEEKGAPQEKAQTKEPQIKEAEALMAARIRGKVNLTQTRPTLTRQKLAQPQPLVASLLARVSIMLKTWLAMCGSGREVYGAKIMRNHRLCIRMIRVTRDARI